MPFKKGQSGNPKGRPKKEKTLTSMIAKELEKVDVKTSNGKTISRKEAIARVVTNLAVKGDFKALKMVFEYMDGKPEQRQEIDVTGSMDVALIKIKNDK